MVKERLAKDREVNGMRLNGFIKPIYLLWVRQAASHLLSEGNGVYLAYQDLNCAFHIVPCGKFLRKGRSDLAQGINPVKTCCESSACLSGWRAAARGMLTIIPGDLAKCFCK